jgi:hypothetical protein
MLAHNQPPRFEQVHRQVEVQAPAGAALQGRIIGHLPQLDGGFPRQLQAQERQRIAR